MNLRLFARKGLVGLLGPVLLLACGPPDTVEVEKQRVVAADSELVMPIATSADRFELRRERTAPVPAPAASELVYATPEGWRDAGPRSMRKVNLLAGESTECYVITLAGEGGGLLANLNRWRGEVGMPPLAEADVDALEKATLLGQSCPLLDVTGNYQGMGGSAGERRVMATLLIRSQGSLFVKMVGPPEEVAVHREGFFAFVESLEESR